MMFTKEQEDTLVEAMHGYQRSLRKIEDAQKDCQDKLNKLKTASGLNESGPHIIDEIKKLLGELYLRRLKDQD